MAKLEKNIENLLFHQFLLRFETDKSLEFMFKDSFALKNKSSRVEDLEEKRLVERGWYPRRNGGIVPRVVITGIDEKS